MLANLWAAFRDYTHQCGVAVALFLILTTGIVVEVRLIRGDTFPAGYDTWIWALVSLVFGVGVVGTAALRATGVPYVEAKAAGKNGSPQVSVSGDANINATQDHPVASALPQAGVRPAPEIANALEQAAGIQHDPNEPDGGLGAAR